jgi:hypothetical protein
MIMRPGESATQSENAVRHGKVFVDRESAIDR